MLMFHLQKYFDSGNKCIDIRFYNTFVKYPIINLIAPSERALRNAMKNLNECAYNIIKKKRADLSSNKKEDILARYINMKDEHGTPLEYSDEYLRDVIMNFIIAGRDTTSQTLTWLFYLLSQNPRAEKLLLDELNNSLGLDTLPDYDNVKDLKYLKACIDETLRLYPPVPNDPKYAVEDDVLPNGYFVKKGSGLVWSAWLMGRLEEYWDCPNEFRPERWFGDNGTKPLPAQQQPPFMPFQIGPRVCLGMQMAYLEVRVLTVMLLRRFKFTLKPGHKMHYKRAVTMNTVHGLHMITELRK